MFACSALGVSEADAGEVAAAYNIEAPSAAADKALEVANDFLQAAEAVWVQKWSAFPSLAPRREKNCPSLGLWGACPGL